jgi:hypothetical protein
MFVHTVYFWLKETSARQQLVEDCTTFLSKIPTVRRLWTGVPAMTPRDVVDNSYDVGLCVILDDAAGHDVYQEHSLHKEFGARNKAHWRRVQVYDFQCSDRTSGNR